ncbi:hypothetical protein EXU48_09690 [Occultella glacieicola]|uniref:Secreted protein n=1 Tax=Occultella glacieicola TaxID=2518684 RepID=A0ABY2E4S0_9MICO|nr:hypothetical protein [Occultella glacieicola]TDE95029.1 hypothetical protein EXU48_09690 [Occultella glacieicola]
MHPRKNAQPAGGAARRRPDRRIPGRLIGALIGVTALAVAVPGPAMAAGNGSALDEAEHHDPGTYALEITDYSQAIEAIAGQPGVEPVSFTDLIASRSGETTACGDACRAWPEHLDSDDRWYPQGLAGSEESNWSDAPDTEVFVSAWYQRISPDDHAAVDSSLKFISTDDWRYRNVPLRLPVRTDDGWSTESLASHNGGVAWAGSYLYVAATDRIHRFDLRTVMTDDDGYFLVPDRTYVGIDQEPYGEPATVLDLHGLDRDARTRLLGVRRRRGHHHGGGPLAVDRVRGPRRRERHRGLAGQLLDRQGLLDRPGPGCRRARGPLSVQRLRRDA